MSRVDAEQTRRWWIELLDARPDPAASARWVEESTDGSDLTLRLESHGLVQTAICLRPDVDVTKVPLVVIPYYDTDAPRGLPSARTPNATAAEIAADAWAPRLVERGMAVLIVPYWLETRASPGNEESELHARYGAAAAEHLAQFTKSGLGRAVGDVSSALEAALALPWIDSTKIGGFGHSLGAKLMLILAAIDERISAVVLNEPGLGFAFSNWGDPWYFDDKVPPGRDLDEMLSLISPRHALYIAGGDFDGEANAYLVHNARELAVAYDKSWLTTCTHTTGHIAPAAVQESAFQWLQTSLDRDGW